MSPRIGLDLPAIVEAAAELADSEGWDAVTLAALAQKLGIRSPSLYNHVNGLPELRKKLALHGMDKFGRLLTAAVEGLTGEEAVYAIGRAYLDFARKHPGLYESTLRDQGDPDIQAVGRRSVDLIVQALRPFGLDYDTTVHIVRGLRSLLHGFVSIDGKGGFGMSLETDASLQIAIGTYLNGIRVSSYRK